MPYSIYIVDASTVSVSGGKTLSGVTQGDGSHLVGETITLSTRAFRPISINDDDTSFGDNDTGQTLNGSQTVNGVTYGGGQIVEAEYGFTATDPDGNVYRLIGFNVRNDSPGFGSIEGLAIVGPQGGFPPAGVPLTVTSNQEGPNFQETTYATPICFVSGTLIETPGGAVPVECLSPGDVVTTINGPRILRWTGRRLMPAIGRHAPVVFGPGTLGNARPLRVSPQHRLWVSDWRAQMLCGVDAVLIPARDFVSGGLARQVEGGVVRYHHLLFDRHAIVLSDGVPSESFQPGPDSLRGLDESARAALLARCRGLAWNPDSYGPAAATDIRGKAARALLAA